MPSGDRTTVSPKELTLQASPSYFGSAPPSGAFTNLTTPDMYNVSPEFGLEHLDNSWPSLFPEGHDQPAAPTDMQRNTSHTSFSTDSASNSPAVQALGSRPSPNHRHSSSGVSKPRRRQGTLKEISYDEKDRVAAKRARNTLAARESRKRKQEHTEYLEEKLAEKEAENELLRQENELLRRQVPN